MSEQAELVERLVRELIATGTLWPETQADLERFVEEAKAGTLWADDLNYLVALHAKIVLGEEANPPAEAEAAPSDTKFQEIRRRFELRYRPDPAAIGQEAEIRARIFEEFWAEFEAVEKG